MSQHNYAQQGELSRTPISSPHSGRPHKDSASAKRARNTALLGELSATLNHAAHTEDESGLCGDSDRLLRVAHELADQLHIHPDETGSCASILNRTYTIAALIKAALQVPGETPSGERLRFIEQAREPLVGLTGDASVLDGWQRHPQLEGASGGCAMQPDSLAQDGPPARQREVMQTICGHISHAEAVASVVAEDCGTDLGWGAIYSIRGLQGRVNEIAQRPDYGTGHLTVFSDVFCEISSLVALINHINLTEKIDLLGAAATLLQVAGHTADEMIDSLTVTKPGKVSEVNHGV